MAPATTEQLEARVAEHIGRLHDHLVDVRRTLHARPELSFEETATTALIAEQLRATAAIALPSPTHTGAVALLDCGRPGQTVLIRADIDALPIQEATGLPFASGVDGCMHACGHDAHAAGLLGVASALSSCAEDLAGRFLFVFQPAEERISGAQAMVDGGLFSDVQPDAAIGLHVVSMLPHGSLLARAGVSMAGGWELQIDVAGSGGHGALQPRQGNVVLAASDIAARLHSVVAGMAYQGTDYVCSPGMIVAGTASNVVPTRAHIAATLRWFEPEPRDEAMQRLDVLCQDVARDFDVRVSVQRVLGTGPVVNDTEVTGLAIDAARRVLPESSVSELPGPVAASDDMSVLLDRVPGCYLMVGAGRSDGSCGMHHSPTFDIDERAIATGAAALCAAAVRLAARPARIMR